MRAHDHARRDAKRAAEDMRRAMARLGAIDFADAHQRRARIRLATLKLDELTRAYQAARFREEWWERAMRAARSPSRRR